MVNGFPVFTSFALTPLPHIFLSKDNVALVADCGKVSLGKKKTNFISLSLLYLPIILARNPPN